MQYKHIMKKHTLKALLLIVVTAFATSAVVAQRGAPKFPEFHYLTVSLGGGYSALFSNIDNTNVAHKTTTQGGPGATFGIGYEYCFRSFWLSLGVEGQYISSMMSPGLDTLHVGMNDTEGDPFTMHYRFDRWRDNTQAVYVNVPFMLGFNTGPFYMGVGAKVGFSLFAQGTSRLEYNTSATYDQFIGDFVDMENHYLSDRISQSPDGKPTKLVFNPNIAVIAELGGEVYSFEGNKKILPWRMKLGAYGEYGFTNINGSASDAPAYAFGDPNPVDLITPAYLSTSALKGKSVNPFYVGVKLTFMFELPVPQKCNCLQDSRGASWRNNAPKATKKQKKNTERGQQDKKD